jgi:hypothetical protein
MSLIWYGINWTLPSITLEFPKISDECSERRTRLGLSQKGFTTETQRTRRKRRIVRFARPIPVLRVLRVFRGQSFRRWLSHTRLPWTGASVWHRRTGRASVAVATRQGSRCDAGAAPATVSGEIATGSHWRRSCPPGRCRDRRPRARRPPCRKGCNRPSSGGGASCRIARNPLCLRWQAQPCRA